MTSDCGCVDEWMDYAYGCDGCAIVVCLFVYSGSFDNRFRDDAQLWAFNDCSKMKILHS